MPAWVINDPESPVGTDNGTADYWKRSCGITEDGKQTLPDTVTYIRSAEPPYAPNQEKEAFRVCMSTIPAVQPITPICCCAVFGRISSIGSAAG